MAQKMKQRMMIQKMIQHSHADVARDVPEDDKKKIEEKMFVEEGLVEIDDKDA